MCSYSCMVAVSQPYGVATSLWEGVYSQVDKILSFLLHDTLCSSPPHPTGSPACLWFCSPYSSLWRWSVFGLESWLYHLLTLWPWTSCLTPLVLSFLISKMGIRTVPSSWGCFESMVIHIKCLALCLVPHKLSIIVRCYYWPRFQLTTLLRKWGSAKFEQETFPRVSLNCELGHQSIGHGSMIML